MSGGVVGCAGRAVDCPVVVDSGVDTVVFAAVGAVNSVAGSVVLAAVITVGFGMVVFGSGAGVVVFVLPGFVTAGDVRTLSLVDAPADVVSEYWHERHRFRKRLNSEVQTSSPNACRTALVDCMHSHAVQTSSSFLVLKWTWQAIVIFASIPSMTPSSHSGSVDVVLETEDELVAVLVLVKNAGFVVCEVTGVVVSDMVPVVEGVVVGEVVCDIVGLVVGLVVGVVDPQTRSVSCIVVANWRHVSGLTTLGPCLTEDTMDSVPSFTSHPMPNAQRVTSLRRYSSFLSSWARRSVALLCVP